MRLLARAKNNNVRHGLITGDRGIGKSSLASQIGGIAKGDEAASLLASDLLDGDRFKFLVAEHIAQGGETVPDIAAGLLADLDRARNQGGLGIKWEIEIDLKLVKGRLERDDDAASRDATISFVNQLEKAARASKGTVDGLLLVVDEIDRVAENTAIATFFKVATEMMTARGLENVMLLPVGMVGVQELLKAEHASVSRIFEVIHVPKLSEREAIGRSKP
jgi:hypothetical protein